MRAVLYGPPNWLVEKFSAGTGGVMGTPGHKPDCVCHICDPDPLGEGWKDAPSGLPLTTGEGNTARQFHIRREHLLEGSALDVDPPFASLDVVLWRDYEAECGRLREQLDAARDAFTEIMRLSQKIGADPGRSLDAVWGEADRACAALGVVGGRPDKDLGSAAEERGAGGDS